MAKASKFIMQEKRMEIFERDRFTCCWCHKSISAYGTPQLGHILKQEYKKIYGDDIVHHPLAVKSTCSLYCNSKFDIGVKSELIEKLVALIKESIERGDSVYDTGLIDLSEILPYNHKHEENNINYF